MELQLPFSEVFIFFLVSFFFILLLIRTWKSRGRNTSSQNKLPPGPWKLPLIGNLFHLVGSLPHHALRALAKKHGPIFHIQLGEISTVVISSARLAKEALTINDLALSYRPQFLASKIIFYDGKDVLFSPYGSYWRQMRKICTLELLSSKKFQSFRPIRETELSRFIDSIRSSSGQPINLSKMIYTLQNTISGRATFGSIYKDQDELVNIIHDIVSSMAGFDVVDLFPSFKFLHLLSRLRSKLKKTHQRLDKILDDIIDEHKKMIGTKPRAEEDLVDVLLRLKESNEHEFPITFDHIKAITLDMFSAGTDTTSTTIEWAMSEMVRNPRVMKKAQVELRQVLKEKKLVNETDFMGFGYLNMVIKETLRLRAPTPLLFPRECREQCEIDGFSIPAKTNIIFNFSAIVRDPDYWDDAESFIPERFENTCIDFKGANFEYIPFGAGRRMCPGSAFGVANVELVLAQLLYHFDWELPTGMIAQDLDMSEAYGVTIRKKKNLYLLPTPYIPVSAFTPGPEHVKHEPFGASNLSEPSFI